MRIAEISTHVLRVPLGEQRFYSSQAAFGERKSLLVRVVTTDGLVGWGEGGQYGPAEPVAAAIEHVLGPLLIGRRADQPVRLWEELYAFSRDFGRKGTYIEAISALDIALWDAWGKSLDRPVHALLGGAHRDRVGAYATGGYYSDRYADQAAAIAELREQAQTYVGSGFNALKVKIGLLPVALDAQRVAVVREAIGTDIDLLVDANHAYNAATAIRMGRALEDQGALWFEEPVVPEDRDGYRRVRDALDVPIAGGEAEFTRYGFRSLLTHGCVDIIQPDICAMGGFSEFTKVLALASSFGVLTVPHVWGSGVALAAATHALAVIPATPHTYAPVPLENAPVIEYDRSPNALRDDLLTEGFPLTDGSVAVPQGPGLGVQIDEDVLRHYTTASATVSR
ncbi:mandelate racemase/muconate lactonizing enzyme family protein [Pseudactinotalea sp. Z1739]|uniref:mandelate racemase/muconate lactonizing enzyme family protein n=1 Tax=Pseudactinotalea sp. Z1739 TaxID=3413028 RepID=UPI003C7D2BFF